MSVQDRPFTPNYFRKSTGLSPVLVPIYLGEGKAINPSGLEPEEAGLTPAALTNSHCGEAHKDEQSADNREVTGSNPVSATKQVPHGADSTLPT